MTKEFRPSTSNIVGTDLSKYKIVDYNQFAVDFMSAIRVHRMPIALNRTSDRIIVSPAYGVFAVNDEDIVLPEYLMLWFSRPEFDRYVDFRSDSAIRGGFDWAELCNTHISLPSLPEQRKIVWEYRVIAERIELLRRLNSNIEEIIVCVFNEFMSHSVENGWQESTLGEITNFISRGITPSYEDCSSEIVLNQKCIRGHMVDFSLSRRHIPKAVSEKWVKYGDLLINSTGTGTLGRTAVVLFDMKNVTVDSHITIVRPKNKDLIYYLGTWGMTHESEIVGFQEGSTGQTELPRERLINMPVWLPETNALRRFNSVIIPFFVAWFSYQREILTLLSTLNSVVKSLGVAKGV